MSDLDIKGMRGVDKNHRCKEVEIDIKGTKVKVRVVSTLKEAEKSLQEIKNGTADFQMLEVMACPGGCINGGGQPRSCDDTHIKEKRAQGLYKEDTELQYRRSNDNPDIKNFMQNIWKHPAHTKQYELLHTVYEDKFKGSYKDVVKS